jgi:hypothetical protein
MALVNPNPDGPMLNAEPNTGRPADELPMEQCRGGSRGTRIAHLERALRAVVPDRKYGCICNACCDDIVAEAARRDSHIPLVNALGQLTREAQCPRCRHLFQDAIPGARAMCPMCETWFTVTVSG